jgi:hypothetical protein
MYIETVPNRDSPPAVLLRESYRQDGKIVKRTLCNLSKWPPELVANFRLLLKGGTAVRNLEESLEVVRTRPHGNVAAVLGTARRIGLERLLFPRPCRERDLVMAMLAERILSPRSKLATARGVNPQCLDSTIGELLNLQTADEDDLYAALDWLHSRQDTIENKLAAQHLSGGSLVLYDVTSTYFEGHKCPLARHGYSRDGKSGKLQIVFGLLCSSDGCPVAVEVFDGNTSDSTTFSAQVAKVRSRFAIERVVWVGDRGMITGARINEDLRNVEGLDWITALRAPQIRELVNKGALQLSLFDEQDLAEIQAPDYPGERLIACRNPLLAQERARKREELLLATEEELSTIVAATTRQRQPLRGQDEIGIRVGKLLGRFKMAKHFRLQITDDAFHYERDTDSIATEAALDGIYIIRTSLPQDTLPAEDTVRAYKSLSQVERAFRSFKTIDLKVRPIYHYRENRVRAHVFLCMLAYYVEWHMRQNLAPMLFDDEDPQAGEALRQSVVAPAQRSPTAQAKAATKRTDDAMPVHSFRTLLGDLATITKTRLRPAELPEAEFDKTTTPTPIQQRALDLLQVKL